MDRCLAAGVFPKAWRTGRVVLLRKPGKEGNEPGSFRPICLLDVLGKVFEWVVNKRLEEHVGGPGGGLAPEQFGFRRGWSAVDAVERVREVTLGAVARGRVAVLVSLDIANAFGSLPWAAIREALARFEVPPYIRRVIASYLSERWIVVEGRGGRTTKRAVTCGVPQGSVLGPSLWNLAYDIVLRTAIPPEVRVFGYADDTVVLAPGRSYEEAVERAERGVADVIRAIETLGLTVAAHKTEAAWITGRERLVGAPAVGAGHGCFGEYLRRIGKEATARCHHCGHEADTTQHPLESCPAWSRNRRALRNEVDHDLAPAAVLARLLAGERSWRAVSKYCEGVMRTKEAAERERERLGRRSRL